MGEGIEKFSPDVLYDLYCLMAPGDQEAFLRRVSKVITAEMLFAMVASLDRVETKQFTDLVHEELTWQLAPILEEQARQIVRENPEITDEELRKKHEQRITECFGNYDAEISAMEAEKLKQTRDRKSDPETIVRNVEICNLRRSNKKKWTLGRLQKKFAVTKRAITKILKDEEKWRRLHLKQRRGTD